MSVSSPARPPSRDQFAAEHLRRSLRRFVPECWPIARSEAFKPNWHIEAICDHLQAVSDGEVRQLVINVPPRHMKSLAVAVFWPCWDWLTHPERQWLFASYAQDLSKRDSVRCRRIIESQGGRTEGGTLLERVGYRGLLDLLGEEWFLASDQNEKMRFENTMSGYRLATSIGGTATGEGGDILVLDDPHKADEIESEVERENVIDWIDGTLSTRWNDPNTGAIVIVMQRLHELDATGHLLAQDPGWEHLCLPAEYEPSHPFVWPEDPRTEPGELLWPGHFGYDALDMLKTKLASYRSAGQLQQRPSPAEGGVLKRAWWRYYSPALLEELDAHGWRGPHFTRLFQAWDTSLKEKTTSDYCVGGLWGAFGADRFLLRKIRGRMGLAATKTAIRDMTAYADRYWPHLSAHAKYIEKAANGVEVLAEMRREIPGMIPVVQSVDKMTRAQAITPQLEAGNVILPGAANHDHAGYDVDRTPAWAQELVEECAQFNQGTHDDQVDMVTIALRPQLAGGSEVKRKRPDQVRPFTAGIRAGGF